MALPIEDYALIGDRHTARAGRHATARSTGCACRASTPPPASPALLGTDEPRPLAAVPDGEYDVDPALRRTTRRCSRRRSRPTTGEVTLTDLMPHGDGRADLVRRRHRRARARSGCGTSGWSGSTTARSRPWVRRRDHRRRGGHHRDRRPGPAGAARAAAPVGRRRPPRRRVRRRERRRADVLDDLDPVVRRRTPTSVRPTTRSRPSPQDEAAWAARCRDDVPHADVVRRSLLTLRLLTDEQTGGIVAAPTTSLPEDFGGERNWDYRYCWLRDAALTLERAGRGRLHRRGRAVAGLAAARGRRRPRGPADHVRRRRLAAGCPSAPSTTCPGYAGSPAGPDRQRRGRRSARPTSSAR